MKNRSLGVNLGAGTGPKKWSKSDPIFLAFLGRNGAQTSACLFEQVLVDQQVLVRTNKCLSTFTFLGQHWILSKQNSCPWQKTTPSCEVCSGPGQITNRTEPIKNRSNQEPIKSRTGPLKNRTSQERIRPRTGPTKHRPDQPTVLSK